jgi:hypothetical protein
MTAPADPRVIRARRLAPATLGALAVTVLLAACGSRAPESAAAASGPVPAATVRATCSQVGAVLSDGPDPTADPVGYAEAQVLPLGQIRTTDPQLRADISALARAYQAFYLSNGTSGAAKQAVAVASERINSLCPGAAS